MTFEEVSLPSFLVPSFPILWFATRLMGSHLVFKWRCKDRQKGNAWPKKSSFVRLRNEKEWKGMKKERIEENRGMNSDNFVFLGSYRRKKSFFRSDFPSYRGKWAEKRGICAENRDFLTEFRGIYSAPTIKKKDYWFIALFIALFQLFFEVLYNSYSFRIFHRELLKELS